MARMRVEESDSAIALLHPLRARILTELRDPASAAEVARRLGLSAPAVNHHVQRLSAAKLIRRVGTRRVRNLTEVLWIAQARIYTIAEKLTPGGERRRDLREDSARRPLRNLVSLGERLCGDALSLLDEAAWDDREFSTFSTSLDLAFPDAASRAAFLADLLEAVRSLRKKYGGEPSRPEERYQAVVACYPHR
jgi:DNA-binding transcriptional ArsR family regulator